MYTLSGCCQKTGPPPKQTSNKKNKNYSLFSLPWQVVWTLRLTEASFNNTKKRFQTNDSRNNSDDLSLPTMTFMPDRSHIKPRVPRKNPPNNGQIILDCFGSGGDFSWLFLPIWLGGAHGFFWFVGFSNPMQKIEKTNKKNNRNCPSIKTHVFLSCQ